MTIFKKTVKLYAMDDLMDYQQRVALLEELYLKNPIDLKSLESYNPFMFHSGQEIDVAIALVAKYHPTVHLFDILEAEDIDTDEYLAEVISAIVQLWFDVKTVTSSSENLLNMQESTDWEVGYKHQLAQYLVDNGDRVQLSQSIYGWADYSSRQKEEPVAVLSVYTEGWVEFVGTFTGVDEKVGVGGVAVYADGTIRKLRCEGEFGHIIRSITS